MIMATWSKIRSEFSLSRSGRWYEYILLTIVGLVIAWSVFYISDKIGILIAAACIGLVVFALCFYRMEIGVYGMVILGFLAAFLQRMTAGNLHMDTVLLSLPFLLFAILLFKNIYEHHFEKIPRHPVLFIYLVITAYWIVQLFNTGMNSRLGWLSFMRGAFVSWALILLFLYVLNDLKNVRFFFKFMIGILFITGLYGVIQQKFGFTSFEYRWLNSYSNTANLFSLPGQGIRKFSFLTDPANFGTLMASTAVGLIAMISGPFKKKEKILLVCFIPFVVLGMSYSGTRTASLMLVAGTALYIVMTIYRKSTLILAFSGVLLLAFILFVPIYGNVTINRFRSAFQPPSKDASFDTRTIHRHQMQPFLHSHPFGNGVNTTMGAGSKYNPQNFLAGFPPDSAYFQISLEQGWVGLLLNCIFLLSLLLFATHYFYHCKNSEIKTYYLMMTVMLFSLMLGAFTQFTLTSIPQNFIFAGFIACIIKLHTFDNPELAEKNPKRLTI